jgi:hypothetical protein
MRVYIENLEEIEDFVYEEYLEIFTDLIEDIGDLGALNTLYPNG